MIVQADRREILIREIPRFDFDRCVRMMDRGFDDCLHSFGSTDDAGNYVERLIRFEAVRTKRVTAAPVLLRLTGGRGELRARVLAGRANPERLVGYVRAWFDLDRNLAPFSRAAGKSARVAALWKRYAGIRLIWVPAPFETLCWSVIGQQINLAFAYQLKRRLVEAYGVSLPYRGAIYWSFPRPEELARATHKQLLSMQFSRQKSEYLRGLADSFSDPSAAVHGIAELSTEDGLALLTDIRGIGRWSANYTMIRAFKRAECFPHGDAGLARAYLDEIVRRPEEKKPNWDELSEFMDGFPGWQAYVTQLLWNAHGDAKRDAKRWR